MIFCQGVVIITQVTEEYSSWSKRRDSKSRRAGNRRKGSNPFSSAKIITPTHWWGVLFWHGIQEKGFERPLRKQSGGLFLGRGRIHGKPTALRKGCWRLSIFGYILPELANRNHRFLSFTYMKTIFLTGILVWIDV